MKILAFVAFLLISFIADANLIIHPTRVQFNPTDRSASISLLNDSNTTSTYRLAWQEKKAKEGGGYIDISKGNSENFPVASHMIRFSPRQVTLKPGERQTIKMSLRRPANLKDGEYRSHFLFKAIPPPETKTEEAAGLQMKVNIITSFLIPVIVQQGELDIQAEVSSATMVVNPQNIAKSYIDVQMNRRGKHSAHGDIFAYWTPQGGQEKQVAKIAGFNLWPELNKTNVKLGWVGSDFALDDGKLRLVFQGARDFRGKTFFDKTFQMNRSQIKIMK